jgi:hypothetical protein
MPVVEIVEIRQVAGPTRGSLEAQKRVAERDSLSQVDRHRPLGVSTQSLDANRVPGLRVLPALGHARKGTATPAPGGRQRAYGRMTVSQLRTVSVRSARTLSFLPLPQSIVSRRPLAAIMLSLPAPPL